MDEKLEQEIQAFDQEPWLPPRLVRGLVRAGIISAIVGTLGFGVFWYKFVAAPSPEEICAHKVALTQRATQDRAQEAGQRLIQKLQDRCVEDAKRRIRLEGKLSYARFARCVIGAQSLDETERC